MALAVDAACRNNETTATCATSRHLQLVKHTHKQVSAIKEGSMVPDASKTCWNVPTCKKADNVKQPHRIVRHTGLQKMAFRAQHHARNASRAHRSMRHTSTHEARASSGRPDRAERAQGSRVQEGGLPNSRDRFPRVCKQKLCACKQKPVHANRSSSRYVLTRHWDLVPKASVVLLHA